RAQGRDRARRPRHGAGRWSLLRPLSSVLSTERGRGEGEGASVAEQIARQLLRRYGIVFRDLLGRESQNLAWRDLLVQYRRMESRGEIRGGRFVGGFTGEQFALPAAVEALRAMRRASPASGSGQELRISGADPLNLVGVILPGPRVPAVPTNYVVFRDGIPVRSGAVPDPGRSESLPIGVAGDRALRRP
ncbi:MAG: Lhr family helicase, partial [Nitrospiraceae bacterium]